MHESALERQMKITVDRDRQIDNLKTKLIEAESRIAAMRQNHKKVAKTAYRNHCLWEEEQKNSAILEKQIRFLEDKYIKLQESVDPSRLEMMHKEMKRQMARI